MSALDQSWVADQRCRALVDAVPVGIHESDPDGGCVRVNKLWSELSGLDAQAAAGEGWIRAVHPGDRPRLLARWRELVDAGSEFQDAEYRFLRPDGTVVRVVGSGFALRDEDGRVAGYAGTCGPARESTERYFDVSRDMFVAIGFDGVFREVRGDVEGVLGWTAEQMSGRRFTHFVHPDEVGLSDLELGRLLSGGEAVDFLNRYRTQTGAWRWLEWRAIGVPELEVVYATARHREQPLAVASSDIQESLRVVTGFLELLQRRYGDRLDEDGMQFVSAALSGAYRVQKLTRSMLEAPAHQG